MFQTILKLLTELRLKHSDTCGCDACLDEADAESNERYWRAKIGK